MKERLQKETSEPKRVKITESTGSERTEEIQHKNKIEAVLSSGDSEAEQRESF